MKYSLLSLIIFQLFSCKTQLLNESQIYRMNFRDAESHVYIYYTRDYEITDQGELYAKTHSLIRIGQDLKSLPEAFYVNDGSVESLMEFEARILKTDGSTREYSIGDLMSFSLSSKAMISEQSLKVLPITDQLNNGDLLEMITMHRVSLPALGIYFDLSVLGDEAYNISCKIKFPKEDHFLYKIVNDSVTPAISEDESSRIYTFKWKKYFYKYQKSIFSQRNNSPALYAAIPRFIGNNDKISAIKTWEDFGKWYLSIAEPKIDNNPTIDSLAQRITSDLKNDKAKIDAIFNFCQKNIRYEQVYLKNGEFIPNHAKTILERKYGDCKDYSTLIIALARSVGLEAHYALCYRGRGYRFYEDIPVSQFNHVIVHFNSNGNNYWYDGTNRIGFPGLTTIDLIGQKALVIFKEHAQLISIDESIDNLLAITGNLRLDDTTLKGRLDIRFKEQYAINFFYSQMYLTEAGMTDYLVNWIHNNLDPDIVSNHISWSINDHSFTIHMDCSLPKTAIHLSDLYYLSFRRCFEYLLPDVSPTNNNFSLFYYPGYNRVKITMYFKNIIGEDNTHIWQIEYVLTHGPFEPKIQSEFSDNFESIKSNYEKKVKFRVMEAS